MSEAPAEVGRLREALAALAEAMGQPAMLVAASWREDTAVNLDAEAARRAAAVVEALVASGAERVTLVLCGEGGRAAFADALRRTLLGWELAYDVCVVDRARGALAALALSANSIVLAPGAGLGAPDTGPTGGQANGPWTREVARHIPPHLDMSDPASARRALAYAHASRQAELSLNLTTTLADERGLDPRELVARLGARRQGDELAAGPAALNALGLDASWARGDTRAALCALGRALEDALALRAAPRPRYEELDFADTVEFAPATQLPGALILSATHGEVYSLDTGSPDPDTGLYLGDWIPLDR